MIIQCDEHVKRSIQWSLRAKGLDAHSIEQEGFKGMPDKELLEFCLKNKRVLLTNDKDFFALAKSTAHAGIIFITDQHASVNDISVAVIRLVYGYIEDEFRNKIFFVP